MPRVPLHQPADGPPSPSRGGTQVRHLRAATLAWPFAGFGRWNRAASPPWFGNPGSVQFDYGARTVRMLPGLDEAEGRMVVGGEAVQRTMADETVAAGAVAGA